MSSIINVKPTAIDSIKKKAIEQEKKLYNQLVPNGSFSPDKLANFIQKIRQDYISINKIKITPGKILSGEFGEEDIKNLLLGEDDLLITNHHDAEIGAELPRGIDNLIEKTKDNIKKSFRIGYANEIIENILATSLGKQLGKKYTITSTASYLISHNDERLADIQITYTNKDDIEDLVLLDSKSSLNNFHILDIDNLQERYKGILIKPKGAWDEYDEFVSSIFKESSGIGDIEIKEEPISYYGGEKIVDLTAMINISQSSANFISGQAINSKYGNISSPLLFVSPARGRVLTLSQLLSELELGKGCLETEIKEDSITSNKRFDGEYEEALKELKKIKDLDSRKYLNKVSLWYGKPQ